MEVNAPAPQIAVPLDDPSGVGLARREAQALARRAGLPDALVADLAIVVSELATNVVVHGRGGTLLLRAGPPGGPRDVEVLAIDRGPGMADVERCFADGYSTAGTLGAGLGAVRRLAAQVDVYSRDGAGTVVRARVGARDATPAALAWGVVSRPLAGELQCGDAWRVEVSDDGARLFVADGLGHGPLAAAAAERAGDLFDAAPLPPDAFMASAHRALTGTRGAAIWAAHLRDDLLIHAGVGNIAARLVSDGATRGLMSYNGTVGHVLGTVRAQQTPWPAGAVLVAHSDGLQSRWTADAYPGLWRCHPSVIAGVLYRDFSRGRDDATVLVAARPQVSR